jgi:tRNA modification GTPase
MNPTIFALATAPGRAAVAVLRLSGPATAEAVEALAGALPAPRRASVRVLRDPVSRETLDEALVLWMPGPASFTGEDQAELHLHGGQATVSSVSEVLLGLGLKPAGPGEFSRRAFEHGKLELSQAEAVADLVDAETAAQRRQALAQLDGALARRYADWREALLEALALLEAEIDFPDEELPDALASRARPPLERLSAELDAALADTRGERVREGMRIALVGAPNAGKSSLINALLGRDAVIVTDQPGTTRDVIEQPMLVAGYKVLVADMAGLRDSVEAIEAEGVRRARAWAEAADLRLWLVDRSGRAGDWRAAEGLARPGDILVLTKADMPEGADADFARAAHQGPVVEISTKAEGGVSSLATALETAVASALSGADFPAATRLRHRAVLAEARDHLARALAGLGGGPERAAEDIRLAARSLERLSGRIDPEEVLGRIFSTFCIGK